jgi:hypothetical protein
MRSKLARWTCDYPLLLAGSSCQAPPCWSSARAVGPQDPSRTACEGLRGPLDLQKCRALRWILVLVFRPEMSANRFPGKTGTSAYFWAQAL